MRTLLLLRHGKAVGSDPAGDHARALTARGQSQADTVAGLLGRLGLRPDLALVSDSRRTAETAERALRGGDTRPRFEPALYAATAATIIETVRIHGGTAARVMVVGHNPGIGEAARQLEGSGEPQATIGLHESFPTGTLAVLEFDIADWADLQPRSGLLARFVVPDRSGGDA